MRSSSAVDSTAAFYDKSLVWAVDATACANECSELLSVFFTAELGGRTAFYSGRRHRRTKLQASKLLSKRAGKLPFPAGLAFTSARNGYRPNVSVDATAGTWQQTKP